MTHRPETRARAVLALLDPWLNRVDGGLAYGDIDLTGSRRRLASLVRGVRAVGLLLPPPDSGPLSMSASVSLRNDAIDALLTFARKIKIDGIGVAGISPEQVEAKTAEVDAGELAALALAERFIGPLHGCAPPPRRRLRCLPDFPPEPRALPDRVMAGSS